MIIEDMPISAFSHFISSFVSNSINPIDVPYVSSIIKCTRQIILHSLDFRRIGNDTIQSVTLANYYDNYLLIVISFSRQCLIT